MNICCYPKNANTGKISGFPQFPMIPQNCHDREITIQEMEMEMNAGERVRVKWFPPKLHHSWFEILPDLSLA